MDVEDVALVRLVRGVDALFGCDETSVVPGLSGVNGGGGQGGGGLVIGERTAARMVRLRTRVGTGRRVEGLTLTPELNMCREERQQSGRGGEGRGGEESSSSSSRKPATRVRSLCVQSSSIAFVPVKAATGPERTRDCYHTTEVRVQQAHWDNVPTPVPTAAPVTERGRNGGSCSVRFVAFRCSFITGPAVARCSPAMPSPD